MVALERVRPCMDCRYPDGSVIASSLPRPGNNGVRAEGQRQILGVPVHGLCEKTTTTTTLPRRGKTVPSNVSEISWGVGRGGAHSADMFASRPKFRGHKGDK